MESYDPKAEQATREWLALTDTADAAQSWATAVTRFAHKQNAVETITQMRDVDGQWRVSGYFIQ